MLKIFGQQSIHHFQPKVLEYDKEKNVRISNTTAIYMPENITFGKQIWIGHFTILDGTGGLEIEDGVQISAYAGIFSHSHAASRIYGYQYFNIPDIEKKAYVQEPVKIGKFSVIGPHTFIMPGVVIGKGALIKQYSYVQFGTQIPDFAVVEGNPAKITGDTRRLDHMLISNDEKLKKLYEEWQ